jgi:hypothetical protein
MQRLIGFGTCDYFEIITSYNLRLCMCSAKADLGAALKTINFNAKQTL